MRIFVCIVIAGAVLMPVGRLSARALNPEVSSLKEETPAGVSMDLPAFPGAQGFGAYARGGRGGRVCHVTTLADGGAGSLREAVEAEGPRIVVFDVSGTIRLARSLDIENPFLTIAGQTAPGDGICLRDATLSIGTDHVVVRYLRCRLGDQGRRTLNSFSCKNLKQEVIIPARHLHLSLDAVVGGMSLE